MSVSNPKTKTVLASLNWKLRAQFYGPREVVPEVIEFCGSPFSWIEKEFCGKSKRTIHKGFLLAATETSMAAPP